MFNTVLLDRWDDFPMDGSAYSAIIDEVRIRSKKGGELASVFQFRDIADAENSAPVVISRRFHQNACKGEIIFGSGGGEDGEDAGDVIRAMFHIP